MGQLVCHGAMTQCTFGAAPSTLTVPPGPMVDAAGMPAATIMDFAPMSNVMPFGTCMSLANPTVAAATAAALGVLTPQACIPATVAPWAPGSTTVLVGNLPALNDSSIAMCAYGGVITVELPGQFTVSVP